MVAILAMCMHTCAIVLGSRELKPATESWLCTLGRYDALAEPGCHLEYLPYIPTWTGEDGGVCTRLQLA